MMNNTEYVKSVWGKAKKGTATEEEINNVFSMLKNGSDGLDGISRRNIEGDLQQALNKIKRYKV